MNEPNAATINTLAAGSSVSTEYYDADDAMSTTSHNSVTSSRLIGENAGQTPKLEGVFKQLQHIVATQRNHHMQKAIIDAARSMLKSDRDIRNRLETLAKFDTPYTDNNDYDTNGRPRVKGFIPASLRFKLEINCSQLVQNDSRCAVERAAIETARSTAMSIHAECLQRIAAQMKIIAESELSARRKLFGVQNFQSIMTLASGYTILGVNHPNRPPIATSQQRIAILGCIRCFQKLKPSSLYSDARLFDNSRLNADFDGKFIEEFLAWTEVRPRDIFDITKTSHPTDDSIANYVRKQLVAVWPEVTTKLWNHDANRNSSKKVDSELADLFESKAIVNANTQLAIAMDSTADDNTIAPLIMKEVERQLQSRAQKSKKSMRKKSSGDAKNQTSKPNRSGAKKAKSGHNKPEKQTDSSKRKPVRLRKKLKTNSLKDDSESVGSSSISSAGTKRRRHHTTPSSPPTSILKKPKVTFEGAKKHSPRRKATKKRPDSDESPDESSSGESTVQRRRK